MHTDDRERKHLFALLRPCGHRLLTAAQLCFQDDHKILDVLRVRDLADKVSQAAGPVARARTIGIRDVGHGSPQYSKMRQKDWQKIVRYAVDWMVNDTLRPQSEHSMMGR